MNHQDANSSLLNSIPEFIPGRTRVPGSGNALIDIFPNGAPAAVAGELAEVAQLGIDGLFVGTDSGVDGNFWLFGHFSLRTDLQERIAIILVTRNAYSVNYLAWQEVRALSRTGHDL
jgi:hypothetical protein